MAGTYITEVDSNNNPIGVPGAPKYTAPVGVKYATIAAGTVASTTIKPSSGIFFGVVIQSVGVGTPSFFDNTVASGNQLGTTLTASAPVGPFSLFPQNVEGVQFANGLTVSGGATNPGMQVYYL